VEVFRIAAAFGTHPSCHGLMNLDGFDGPHRISPFSSSPSDCETNMGLSPPSKSVVG
jgi:hypothetical protein